MFSGLVAQPYLIRLEFATVRWLLANGKGAEAKEIIQEAARTNKVQEREL